MEFFRDVADINMPKKPHGAPAGPVMEQILTAGVYRASTGLSTVVIGTVASSRIFRAVGFGFLPLIVRSLSFPSLVTAAGQIPGNLPGNVSPHVVIP